MKQLGARRFETFATNKGWRTLSVPGVPRDSGSLTAALRRIAAVKVLLLRQGYAMPDAHERRMLGRRAGRRVILREILLICADHPVVYGRSAIPLGERRGAWCALASLGTRALGDLIFTDPVIQRSSFVLKRLATHDPLLRRLDRLCANTAINSIGGPIYGARRCLIRRRGRDIALTEIFLAEFPVAKLLAGGDKSRAPIIRP